MATTVVSPPLAVAAQQRSPSHDRKYASALITGLTCLAIILHGYHPYAEDGGLYLAGIKRLVNPGLYPHQTAFVEEHLRFSIFAPVAATAVRYSRLSAETVMFLLYGATIWITLFTAWKLTARCYRDRRARTGAVGLLAIGLTLPIAGTSLMLMDPYVTARSISTPCALIALAGILDLDEERRRCVNGLIMTGCALVFGTLFHPLMMAYAIICAIVLAAILRFPSAWPLISGAACFAAISAAASLQALSAPEGNAYRRVALTRAYWFPSQWRWYEWFGLVAPLMIMGATAIRRHRDRWKTASLAQMSVTVGLTSTAVALLFARVHNPTHIIARLQPLRSFQIVYILMLLFLGAELGTRLLKQSAPRWIVVLATLGSAMLIADRRVYPDLAHIEWPWHTMRSSETNPWLRAFLWMRENTPRDALVALDAHYIELPGEDAQCFRAIAERSALPDYSKDGGEASITPSLTQDWIRGESAQEELSAETDENRISALRPFGVDWIVLEKTAVTAFVCDYANEAVKVCRMPRTPRTALSSNQPRALPLPRARQ